MQHLLETLSNEGLDECVADELELVEDECVDRTVRHQLKTSIGKGQCVGAGGSFSPAMLETAGLSAALDAAEESGCRSSMSLKLLKFGKALLRIRCLVRESTWGRGSDGNLPPVRDRCE